MNIGTADLTVFITRDGNELVTDSRAVALAFGKRHKNVLQIIDKMRASGRTVIANHAGLNFQPSTYADRTGRSLPMYRMTAKGLSELAMGFSGDDSREVRIRFLNAFDDVSARLLRAEKTITQMLHEHDKRSAVSETKGRIGSLLMHERRKEKPALKAEESQLRAVSQPSLLN